MYSEDDLILISGLQHLEFCERQWMLIYIERQWQENLLTIEGDQLHKNVHQAGSQSRGELRLATGLMLKNEKLGLYGVADMVEFHRDDDGGIVVPGFKERNRRWRPYPVEYKRGRKRWDVADETQLCAQALCLEEMLGASIAVGAIYYGEPRRRTEIELTDILRMKVEALCSRARALASGSAQPQYTPGRQCRACSLNELCMPELTSDNSACYVAGLFKI